MTKSVPPVIKMTDDETKPESKHEPNKREQTRVYKVDTKASKPTNPKGDNAVWRLIFEGLMAFFGIQLDGDAVACDRDWFRFEDLRGLEWFEWVCANKDEVNRARLPAKFRGDAPSDETLRRWMRGFGIRLKSKRIDVHKLEVGARKDEDDRVRVYQVSTKAMKPLLDVLERRYKAGTMPWVKTALDYMKSKAQMQVYDDEFISGAVAAFEDGMVVQAVPDKREISEATARNTVRYGILESLRIRFDNNKYVCDPNFFFRYEDLTSEYWYKWACEYKDVVNRAGLGAQFSGDAPSVQVVSKWIKAMGIGLQSKQIDAHKLLINKGRNDGSPVNTGNGKDKIANTVYPCHPNKSVGGENKTQEKRERMKVYNVKPKSLEKMAEIMDKDVHEKIAPPVDQVRSVNAPNPSEKLESGDPQVLIKMIADDPECQELSAVLARLERLEGLSDDIWERIIGLLVNFSTGVVLYDKDVFLDTVSGWF